MNRQELASYLTETYSTTDEHLFRRVSELLNCPVCEDQKMIYHPYGHRRKRMGFTGKGKISSVNLKCDT